MIVHLSAEAGYDLETIGDYIARDNPVRALSFLHELRAKCLGLAEIRERFPLVPRFETSGVRRREHGDYLIFYRVEARTPPARAPFGRYRWLRRRAAYFSTATR